MRGYLDGFEGCNFMTGATTTVAQAPAPQDSAESIWDVLPQASAIPHDLTLVAEYERPLADVVVNYTDPVLTDALFREWGWQGNIVQRYEGTGWSTGVTSVYISIHEFDGRQGASGALAHSVEDQMVSTGAWTVPVAAIGEETIGLATADDATVYARSGNVVIRLTVTTTGGDALPVAEAIVATMLG